MADGTSSPWPTNASSGNASSASQATASAAGWTDAVIAQVATLAQNLGVSFADLVTVWNSESSLIPSANNGTAAGLNQMLSGSLGYVGFKGGLAAFAKLSITNQLPYIAAYYSISDVTAIQWYGAQHGVAAIYLSNASLGSAKYASDPNHVVYAAGTKNYNNNTVLDANGDGVITTQDLVDTANNALSGKRGVLARAVIARASELSTFLDVSQNIVLPKNASTPGPGLPPHVPSVRLLPEGGVPSANGPPQVVSLPSHQDQQAPEENDVWGAPAQPGSPLYLPPLQPWQNLNVTPSAPTFGLWRSQTSWPVKSEFPRDYRRREGDSNPW